VERIVSFARLRSAAAEFAGRSVQTMRSAENADTRTQRDIVDGSFVTIRCFNIERKGRYYALKGEK